MEAVVVPPGAPIRFTRLVLTRHQGASRLLAEREAIMAELERAREDYLKATAGTFA